MAAMGESENRSAQQARPVRLTPGYVDLPEGSVLIETGDTRVLCNASVEDKVPSFLRGKGQGWVTAEYQMLPRSTHTRTPRESSRGRLSGRTQEIQRLIGRSIRSVVDLTRIPDRTIWLDCDVIQADGGTRTAAITGAFVATALAIDWMLRRELIPETALIDTVAAVSVGIVEGVPRLDLCYAQDVQAEVDMNVVMTGRGQLVEIQGTAEGKTFSRAELDELVDLASSGIAGLTAVQTEVLGQHLGNVDHLLPGRGHEDLAVPSGNH